MGTRSILARKYNLLRQYLTRQQLHLWAAVEAECIGPKGISIIATATGVPKTTISCWIKEVRAAEERPEDGLSLPRMWRHVGRKFTEVNDPGIEPALEKLVTHEIAGEPTTNQRWVRSSLRKLSQQLAEQRHKACTHTVARLLRKMGFSLRVNKKKQSGSYHPDRDTQFNYIKNMKENFSSLGLPIISIDTKKKELIGEFKNSGKVWSKEGIEVEHFASYAKYVAVPFGIYDVNRNSGYVVVGISRNTAELAVNCIVRWWQNEGRENYPSARHILILADGGGGNGYNLRSWKKDLQTKFCDPMNLSVTVCHYPTGCSRWNPVEYRLFSQISMNWAGRPLQNLELMLGYIRGTSTSTGLRVEGALDTAIYQKGRKVTAREMKELSLVVHETCPNWNYTLSPSRLGS